MARVFALSDLHLDYRDNRDKFDALSASEYARDALLLGGDLTHDLGLLEEALASARAKFAEVFFVPGNHELWLRENLFEDSWQKFEHILGMCRTLGVRTDPLKLATDNGDVWVVPLFSWYVQPHEGDDSLHKDKPGEDKTLSMWLDNQLIKWPDWNGRIADEVFLELNRSRLQRRYDAPVLSFSHFLPRTDLVFRTPAEIAQGPPMHDRNPAFNFTSVAGSQGLERQIRALGSRVHVYGHQHRNRHREVEGVTYISHCMGYPRETYPDKGDVNRPKAVW